MTRRAEHTAIRTETGRDKFDEMADDCKTTVYFDGSCPLCSAEIGHYQSQEGSGNLHFVDISEEEADPGPDLDRKDALGRFYIRRADGTLMSGARGFIAIWDALPKYRWAARIARLPGVTSVLEVAYRIFLPIRPWLSRLAGLFGAKARNPVTNSR